MYGKAAEKLKQTPIDSFLKKSSSLAAGTDIKENTKEMSRPIGGASLFKFKSGKSTTSAQKSQLNDDIQKAAVTLAPRVENIKSIVDNDYSDLQEYALKSISVRSPKKEKKPVALLSEKPKVKTKETKPLSVFTQSKGFGFLDDGDSNDEKPKQVKSKEIKPLSVFTQIKGFAFLDDDSNDEKPVSTVRRNKSLFKVKTPNTQNLAQKPDNPLEIRKKFMSSSITSSINSSLSSIVNSTPGPSDNSTKSTASPLSTPPKSSCDEVIVISTPPVSDRLNRTYPTPSVKIDESNNILSEYEQLRKCDHLDSLDHQQLLAEQFKFYKYFYDIHNQLPLTMYENVEGYDKTLVVKIKSMIQSLKLRIKRKESQNKIASLVSGIKSKGNNDKAPADDDQLDIDEIMKEVEVEKRICKGQYNNSYVDLSTPPTSSFKPRINLKDTMSSSASSSASRSQNNRFDNDGFPMVDYSQLIDVVPSKSNSVKKDFIDLSMQNESSHTLDLNSSSIGRFHSSVQNDGITGEFDKTYTFSQEIRDKFKNRFGLREFRQNQLQAINASMLKLDCFILMPTGGGKSLCYQLPAVCNEGVTIVVSPLKSLIFDQVNKLNTLDIKSVALSGELSSADAKHIYSDINSSNPTIKLLYITPEKISASTFVQDTFTSMYNKGTLARFVIDEAHCVSTWGHDFRPDYKRLGELKRRFPNVPLMALTATANPRVRADVIHQLQIPRCKWFLSSFNRPNLKYIVLSKKGASTLDDIISLIKVKYAKASGIIYCFSRKDCETTAEKLQLANISATHYHAGLSDKAREKAQQDWLTDNKKIVCATIAFGMGIDKPDVRFVIHYSLPKSIEGYYQEAGRAGRDGKISTCMLYYSYSDKIRYLNMISKEPPACQQVSRNNLDLVVNFCENMVDCRRNVILNYFGEHFTRQQCLQNEATACDNCKRTEKYKELNVTDISKKIVNAVRELCDRNRFTVLQLVDVFKGANTKKVREFGHDNTSYHGSLANWDRSDIQRLFHKLIIEHYLVEEIIVMKDIPQSYIKVGSKAGDLMQRGAQVNFSVMENKQAVVKKKAVEVPKPAEDEEFQSKLQELYDGCYSDLMILFREIASEKATNVTNIINLNAVKDLSIQLPQTEEEMLQIPHVTKALFDKYGERILLLILPYSAQYSCYLMDRQEELDAKTNAQNAHESDNESDNGNGVDWDQIGSQASVGSRRGSKRKSTGWSGKKVLKKYKASHSKKKTPAKKTASQKAKNSSISKPWSSGGARKNNLMPLPKPTF